MDDEAQGRPASFAKDDKGQCGQAASTCLELDPELRRPTATHHYRTGFTCMSIQKDG